MYNDVLKYSKQTEDSLNNMMTNYKWYIVEIVYRVHNSTAKEKIRFDKQLRLIKAIDGKEAFQKALALASDELYKLNNTTLKYLQWEYIGLGSFKQAESIEDGMELQYTIEEPLNIPEFIQNLRYTNENILQQLSLSA